MLIGNAIDLLKPVEAGLLPLPTPKSIKAVRLGLEALKRIYNRRVCGVGDEPPLPGEEEE